MRTRCTVATALRVGLVPTLPFHAGVSMQVYAAVLVESLAGVPGLQAELLTPPFTFRSRVGWIRSRWIRYVAYPAWVAARRADVYHVVDHGNAQLLWRLPRAKTVVTCHDLYPFAVATGQLRFPGAPMRARMLPTALRLLALRRARMILTVSEHTGDECRRYLGIPATRLRVVYESLPAKFWAPCDVGEVAKTQARLGIGPDDLVVLHVGSNDPRKNLSTVCRVLARLRASTRRPVKLVKVGARLGRGELDSLRTAGLDADVVRCVDRVDTAELVRIYHSATVLLYPSFYEGFCRPVVEAMAAGLPVVASAAGAIPEIAGNVAALHDPTDVEGMAVRIAEIGEDVSLRKEMAEAGREASRRFAAEVHGQAVADVYSEVTSW